MLAGLLWTPWKHGLYAWRYRYTRRRRRIARITLLIACHTLWSSVDTRLSAMIGTSPVAHSLRIWVTKLRRSLRRRTLILRLYYAFLICLQLHRSPLDTTLRALHTRRPVLSRTVGDAELFANHSIPEHAYAPLVGVYRRRRLYNTRRPKRTILRYWALTLLSLPNLVAPMVKPMRRVFVLSPYSLYAW